MNISHFRFILFNLKVFGEIVTPKDKICQTWGYHVEQLALKWTFKTMIMNSHNELVSQKSRRVKLMGLLEHFKR